ncbi:Triokinase/FMN cyclase [Chionoecetes opilio]|uniref:Triokinase/FMN cyclase n=1 Tax=Chionoecetes opilio TaxID=41210 RepID=A0A8J8WMI7_CHIOP|nr:Triokinase/FMN cyclase [Chionoecetes opilio]
MPQYEQGLNALDAECGDGDCGSTFLQGLAGVSKQLSTFPLSQPGQVLSVLGEVADTNMGGSSGGIYSIFFTAAAATMARPSASHKVTWATALHAGVKAIKQVRRSCTRRQDYGRGALRASGKSFEGRTPGARCGAPWCWTPSAPNYCHALVCPRETAIPFYLVVECARGIFKGEMVPLVEEHTLQRALTLGNEKGANLSDCIERKRPVLKKKGPAHISAVNGFFPPRQK